MAKIRISIPVPAELLARIQAAAKAADRPIASWARIAIVKVLDAEDAECGS